MSHYCYWFIILISSCVHAHFTQKGLVYQNLKMSILQVLVYYHSQIVLLNVIISCFHNTNKESVWNIISIGLVLFYWSQKLIDSMLCHLYLYFRVILWHIVSKISPTVHHSLSLQFCCCFPPTVNINEICHWILLWNMFTKPHPFTGNSYPHHKSFSAMLPLFCTLQLPCGLILEILVLLHLRAILKFSDIKLLTLSINYKW